MITIDAYKEKFLEFTISLVGKFHSGKIDSFFRIYFENFNIGFPAKISNFEKVIVQIPKLHEFVNPSLIESKAKGALEIISERDMFLAWQDDITLKFTNIKANLESNANQISEVKITASLDENIDKEFKKEKNIFEIPKIEIDISKDLNEFNSLVKNKTDFRKKQQNVNKILEAFKN